MQSKFYILDFGEDIVELAEAIVEALKVTGNYVIIFKTDQPKELTVTEIEEGEYWELSINLN